MLRKFRILIFILLITALESFPVHGQVIEVNAWLDTTAIKIGEQVQLHLDVKRTPGSQTLLPRFTDKLTAKVEVISSDSGSSNNGQLITGIYTITSFDSGTFRLPPLPVTFSYEGFTDTIYSSPLVLNVYSPVVDTSKAIMDIKPPLNAPVTLKETIPYILVSAGVLVLAALVLYLVKRLRRKKPEEVKPGKMLPAHIIAFNDLDRLKEEKLWQSGMLKEFYVRLSDVIRVYLENRYGFKAMESVTDEIMDEFRKYDSDPQSNEMLREILQTSDMVKFAKGEPLPSENQTNLEKAYLFVEKTKFVELLSVEELQKQAKAEVN